MPGKSLAVFAAILFIMGCTQLLEEEDTAKTNYTGDDGCVYCHTNQDRLAALAIAEETASAGGG